MDMKSIVFSAVIVALVPGVVQAFEHTGTTVTLGFEHTSPRGELADDGFPTFSGPQLTLRSGARMGQFSGRIELDLRQKAGGGERTETTRAELHLAYAITDEIDIGAYHSRYRFSVGDDFGSFAETIRQTGLTVAYTGDGFGVDAFAGQMRLSESSDFRAREFGVGGFVEATPELRLGAVFARLRESNEGFSGTTVGANADYSFGNGLMASATVLQYRDDDGFRLRNVSLGLEYGTMAGSQPMVLSAEVNRTSLGERAGSGGFQQVRLGVTVPLGSGATNTALNSQRAVVARRPVAISSLYDSIPLLRF